MSLLLAGGLEPDEL